MASRVEVKYCIRCGDAVELHPSYGQVRPLCPSCGWIYFADPKVAVGVLLEEGNKVLMVQRGCEPHRGRWTFPAGFVNAGEAPADAAVRECLEETGLKVCLRGVLDIYAKKEHPGGADFIIIYRAEVIAGQLSAADDATDARWFARDALPEIAFDATRYFLENF